MVTVSYLRSSLEDLGARTSGWDVAPVVEDGRTVTPGKLYTGRSTLHDYARAILANNPIAWEKRVEQFNRAAKRYLGEAQTSGDQQRVADAYSELANVHSAFGDFVQKSAWSEKLDSAYETLDSFVNGQLPEHMRPGLRSVKDIAQESFAPRRGVSWKSRMTRFTNAVESHMYRTALRGDSTDQAHWDLMEIYSQFALDTALDTKTTPGKSAAKDMLRDYVARTINPLAYKEIPIIRHRHKQLAATGLLDPVSIYTPLDAYVHKVLDGIENGGYVQTAIDAMRAAYRQHLATGSHDSSFIQDREVVVGLDSHLRINNLPGAQRAEDIARKYRNAYLSTTKDASWQVQFLELEEERLAARKRRSVRLFVDPSRSPTLSLVRNTAQGITHFVKERSAPKPPKPHKPLTLVKAVRGDRQPIKPVVAQTQPFSRSWLRPAALFTITAGSALYGATAGTDNQGSTQAEPVANHSTEAYAPTQIDTPVVTSVQPAPVAQTSFQPTEPSFVTNGASLLENVFGGPLEISSIPEEPSPNNLLDLISDIKPPRKSVFTTDLSETLRLESPLFDFGDWSDYETLIDSTLDR